MQKRSQMQLCGYGSPNTDFRGSNRPEADSLTGTRLVSLRLESIYETRGHSKFTWQKTFDGRCEQSLY
ncbi:hypothetical protein EMIT051CA3_20430 [Pseudomonas chlororaphis]